MMINNIISQAEFRHQRYVIQNSRSGWAWVGLAMLMLLPALFASVMMFVSVLFGLGWGQYLIEPQGSLLGGVFQVASIALMTMNIALYIVVTLITLGLSYNSIAREHTNRTWDILLLTHVDAPTLIVGKWWGSLRSLSGDHLMLFILRVGVVAQFIDGNTLNLSAGERGAYLVGMMLLLAAFTVVDTALTVVLGVAAALPSARSTAMLMVLMLRFVWVIINSGALMTLPLLMLNDWQYSVFAIGGIILSMLMTWGVLWGAQWFAARGQVSS
ncbi:MAG: hypothetical protein D6711_00890 [Chloroflexi bacterium]|nr:MAG: hypothetical protein D6711_00890 [Chloroflexota bacterium]